MFTGWAFRCGWEYRFRRAHMGQELWCGQFPSYLCISAISARRRSISSFSEAICLRRNCSMASSSSCSVKISFSCNDQLVHLRPWLYFLQGCLVSDGAVLWQTFSRSALNSDSSRPQSKCKLKTNHFCSESSRWLLHWIGVEMTHQVLACLAANFLKSQGKALANQ